MVNDTSVMYADYVAAFDLSGALQPDGSLLLEILNRPGILSFVPVGFEQADEGTSYRWLGRTEDGLFNVALGGYEGYFGGFVTGEGRYWEFVPIEPDKTIFRELISEEGTGNCSTEGHSLEAPANDGWKTLVDNSCEAGECDAAVDILLVSTPGVANWYGNNFGGGNNFW